MTAYLYIVLGHCVRDAARESFTCCRLRSTGEWIIVEDGFQYDCEHYFPLAASLS